ncbi:MAG: hypothetical protein V1820_00875 [archaeon]
MSLIVAATLPPKRATVLVADGRRTSKGERGPCGHHSAVESDAVGKLWRDSGSSIYGLVGATDCVEQLLFATDAVGYSGLIEDFAEFFRYKRGALAGILVAEGARIARLDSGIARLEGELDAQQRYGELMTRKVRDRNKGLARFAAVGCGEAHLRKDRIRPEGLDARSFYNTLEALASAVERVSGVCCAVGKPYLTGFSIEGEPAVILPLPDALDYARGLDGRK